MLSPTICGSWGALRDVVRHVVLWVIIVWLPPIN
jgi:hypothetical protein